MVIDITNRHISIELAKTLYPIGEKVFVPSEELHHIYTKKADWEIIANEKWTVLNYYYVIGSRCKTICGIVVGIGIETLQQCTPNALSLKRYSWIPPMIDVLDRNTAVPMRAKLLRKIGATDSGRDLFYLTLHEWDGSTYNGAGKNRMIEKDAFTTLMEKANEGV